MHTMVGSAFHTPVFSNCGAGAGGRWRISGPGATPLMTGGSPATEAGAAEASAVGRNGAPDCAPTHPGSTPTPSASAPNVAAQLRNRLICSTPLTAPEPESGRKPVTFPVRTLSHD